MRLREPNQRGREVEQLKKLRVESVSVRRPIKIFRQSVRANRQVREPQIFQVVTCETEIFRVHGFELCQLHQLQKQSEEFGFRVLGG